MAWIESHQGTDRHPKTRKLCRKLGIPTPAAVGHLHMFWWWAMDFAQDGDISKYGPDDIADAVEWPGDSEQLFDALIDVGFIDKTETGHEIHDWYAYAGRLIETRKKDAERKRKSRDERKAAADKSKGSPADIQRTDEGQRSESTRDLNPNLNHNQYKDKELCPEPPSADQDVPPPDDDKEKGDKEPKYGPDSIYYKMALYFKGKIDEMAAKEGLEHLTKRTNLQKWSDDFRKLVELDKQSDRDLLREVMDWVVTDDFWRSNVMSADKFRDKFPKLVMDMRKAKRPGKGKGNTGSSGKQAIEIVQQPAEQEEVSEEEVRQLMEMAERMKAGST